ncbi:tetratricopeptide repeat protein [uncultured Tateyamaria sp.]|uniref:tetratricopeptide repeat protein n=1 Tax=uncultured Tateyamaria sp. TaxID=455651 RepID=UPI002609B83A|nr:sel1 repeat family protein [uncultured Tateyamaria sp.]
MHSFFPTAILIAFGATSAAADEFGTLNPDEMTWQHFLDQAERGETGMVICSMGYALTKSGDHASARTLFRNCANDGYTGAMTWMSQLDNNGLGAEYDPDSAAEWDRRAAQAGDPVGKFNYGISLMRGHGVAQDDALGRQLVDEAARDGLMIAKRLQRAGYDLDEVTPDADNWKYAPSF